MGKKQKNKSTQTDEAELPAPVPAINLILVQQSNGDYENYEEYDEDGGEYYEDGDCAEDPDYKPGKDGKDAKDAKAVKYDENAKLKRYYTNDDSKYYDKLNKKQKKVIDKTEKELVEIDFFKTPMRFKILESNMDLKLKSLALKKIDELSMMCSSSSEYFKMKRWIENMCRLPIGKYKKLPVTNQNTTGEIISFMDTVKTKFNELVFGHNEAKEEIVKLLAKWISNPKSNGIVIGIHGPMGTGKTSLGMALCEALNLPFGFISLAGISGEPIFTGHSYTYEGSKWGKIADILMSTDCMNPIMYFDELDKISDTKHGQEVANFLIHLTDMTQNSKFQDHYFGDIDLDLSKSIFIFSYNNEALLNPILKDRMITIKTKGYTIPEKISLTDDYMLPRALKEYGFEKDDLAFNNTIIKYIIGKIAEEKGARNLKRALEEIIGNINFQKLTGELKDFPITITEELVDKYLLLNCVKEDRTSYHMMYV
jgi:ATP-dependent Lon protease